MTKGYFYAFYENKTTTLGETGIAVTVEADKVNKTTGTQSLVASGTSAVEMRKGRYRYEIPDYDPVTYDYLVTFVTASNDVLAKEVPGMRWDGAEGHNVELAYLDALISSLATAAALAVVDGIVDAILVDTGTTLPAQIETLLLTNATTAAASSTDGADLTLTNKLTFSALLEDLTIPATWLKIYLTVKNTLSLAVVDSNSILQIVVTNGGHADDGILYVNKTAATTAQKAYGSLTADQGAGTLAVAVADDMAFTTNSIGNWKYDIKIISTPGTTSTKPASSAAFVIQLTETETI